jgi:hypothetical protein
MALWAGLVAMALAVLVLFAPSVDYAFVLRSLMELAAVCGVFALICAAEASQ